MRKASILLVTLLALATLRASAAVKSCTTARVTAGDCQSNTQVLLQFALDAGAAAELEDALCARFGFPLIVCEPADVTAGRCTADQLGRAVASSETRRQFANRMHSEILRNWITAHRLRLAEDAARATVTAPGPIQ